MSPHATPLPIGATLRDALLDVRRVAWSLVALALVPAMPAALLVARVECEGGCVPMTWLDRSQIVEVFDLLLGAPLALAAVHLLVGRTHRIGPAIAAGLRKGSSAIEIRLVVGLMTFIGLFLLVVPAVAIVVATSLAYPALALDQADSNRALIASSALARRRFLPLLAIVAAASSPGALVAAAGSQAAPWSAGTPGGRVAALAIELTLGGLAGAYALAAMSRAYLRLRAQATGTVDTPESGERREIAARAPRNARVILRTDDRTGQGVREPTRCASPREAAVGGDVRLPCAR